MYTGSRRSNSTPRQRTQSTRRSLTPSRRESVDLKSRPAWDDHAQDTDRFKLTPVQQARKQEGRVSRNLISDVKQECMKDWARRLSIGEVDQSLPIQQPAISPRHRRTTPPVRNSSAGRTSNSAHRTPTSSTAQRSSSHGANQRSRAPADGISDREGDGDSDEASTPIDYSAVLSMLNRKPPASVSPAHDSSVHSKAGDGSRADNVSVHGAGSSRDQGKRGGGGRAVKGAKESSHIRLSSSVTDAHLLAQQDQQMSEKLPKPQQLQQQQQQRSRVGEHQQSRSSGGGDLVGGRSDSTAWLVAQHPSSDSDDSSSGGEHNSDAAPPSPLNLRSSAAFVPWFMRDQASNADAVDPRQTERHHIRPPNTTADPPSPYQQEVLRAQVVTTSTTSPSKQARGLDIASHSEYDNPQQTATLSNWISTWPDSSASLQNSMRPSLTATSVNLGLPASPAHAQWQVSRTTTLLASPAQYLSTSGDDITADDVTGNAIIGNGGGNGSHNKKGDIAELAALRAAHSALRTEHASLRDAFERHQRQSEQSMERMQQQMVSLLLLRGGGSGSGDLPAHLPNSSHSLRSSMQQPAPQQQQQQVQQERIVYSPGGSTFTPRSVPQTSRAVTSPKHSTHAVMQASTITPPKVFVQPAAAAAGLTSTQNPGSLFRDLPHYTHQPHHQQQQQQQPAHQYLQHPASHPQQQQQQQQQQESQQTQASLMQNLDQAVQINGSTLSLPSYASFRRSTALATFTSATTIASPARNTQPNYHHVTLTPTTPPIPGNSSSSLYHHAIPTISPSYNDATYNVPLQHPAPHYSATDPALSYTAAYSATGNSWLDPSTSPSAHTSPAKASSSGLSMYPTRPLPVHFQPRVLGGASISSNAGAGNVMPDSRYDSTQLQRQTLTPTATHASASSSGGLHDAEMLSAPLASFARRTSPAHSRPQGSTRLSLSPGIKRGGGGSGMDGFQILSMDHPLPPPPARIVDPSNSMALSVHMAAAQRAKNAKGSGVSGTVGRQ